MEFREPFKETLEIQSEELNNAIPRISPESVAREKIEELVSKGLLPGRVQPLTEEEARAVDEKVAALKKKGSALREQILFLKQRLDETVLIAGKPEPKVTIDLQTSPALRKAIQDIFGYKTNEITYTMYKQVIDAKRQLEESEINDILGRRNANL